MFVAVTPLSFTLCLGHWWSHGCLQEIPLSVVAVKNTAPPSYEEVFGQICKDDPPLYQDIVQHSNTPTQNIQWL